MVSDLVDTGELDYLSRNDTGLKLNKCSRGYFEQVQLLMAVCEVDVAYFLVWTTMSCEVVIVDFDRSYWENEMLPNIQTFFTEFVVAELLTSRVLRGLPLTSIVQSQVTQEATLTEHNISSATNAVCCSPHCNESTGPKSITGKILHCSANIVCPKGSFFHFICEGFRRSIHVKTLKKSYTCTACRLAHPLKAKLLRSKGFL
jgi:hypothetical protein